MALSIATSEPGGETPLRPAIDDLMVLDYVGIEEDFDPKFPGPRPVHVLGQDTVEVLVRTHGVERLDIVVQVSGTDSFGLFSGIPDRNGLVTIKVEVPEGGSWHDFRVPGPEGIRRPGQIEPRTIFTLHPTGYVACGGLSLSGDPVWVRLEE
jgi:hypothetical protein